MVYIKAMVMMDGEELVESLLTGAYACFIARSLMRLKVRIHASVILAD